MEEPRSQNINFKNNNIRPKGRRSAPKAEERQTGKENPIAYRFKDPRVGEFDVLNSANGWWAEETFGVVKVQKLVDAYCFYMTDQEACSYAGITEDNLKYFQKIHPDFYTIKHSAKAQPGMHAKKTIIGKVEKEPSWAAWWLERTDKDNFSTRQEQTGANGRDLYDGLTARYKKLTEDIENEYIDDEESEEHADVTGAGHTDAGPDGDGDAAASTEGTSEAKEGTA